MAVLIRRSEVLDRLNKLEEKAMAASDLTSANMCVKMFNAVMSCEVQDKVFCSKCGKPVKTEKIHEGGS